MSWNKNTINHSKLDEFIEVWEKQNKCYVLYILGFVKGYGLNDDEDTVYAIRKAINWDDNMVVLERMERTHDCDCDDTIVSYIFPLGDCPENWEIEVYVDNWDDEWD